MEGGVAGLVLLAGCILVFRKRAGIVLLHGGVALVMANELVVHMLHVEGQMHIREGETVNYVQDIRTVELAIIDASDSKTDDVTVVPRSLLKLDAPIHDDQLPFDVEVVEYLQNAELQRAKPEDKNQATAGAGLQWIAVRRKAGVGTDAGGKVDATAAYVKLTPKGQAHRSAPTCWQLSCCRNRSKRATRLTTWCCDSKEPISPIPCGWTTCGPISTWGRRRPGTIPRMWLG